jgi:hypothetical protein
MADQLVLKVAPKSSTWGRNLHARFKMVYEKPQQNGRFKRCFNAFFRLKSRHFMLRGTKDQKWHFLLLKKRFLWSDQLLSKSPTFEVTRRSQPWNSWFLKTFSDSYHRDHMDNMKRSFTDIKDKVSAAFDSGNSWEIEHFAAMQNHFKPAWLSSWEITAMANKALKTGDYALLETIYRSYHETFKSNLAPFLNFYRLYKAENDDENHKAIKVLQAAINAKVMPEESERWFYPDVHQLTANEESAKIGYLSKLFPSVVSYGELELERIQDMLSDGANPNIDNDKAFLVAKNSKVLKTLFQYGDASIENPEVLKKVIKVVSKDNDLMLLKKAFSNDKIDLSNDLDTLKSSLAIALANNAVDTSEELEQRLYRLLEGMASDEKEQVYVSIIESALRLIRSYEEQPLLSGFINAMLTTESEKEKYMKFLKIKIDLWKRVTLK